MRASDSLTRVFRFSKIIHVASKGIVTTVMSSAGHKELDWQYGQADCTNLCLGS